jgi:TrkA domain protein
MTTVEETPLPGVGVRYEMALKSGQRVGVLVHRTGRRELFFYSARDPDAVAAEVVTTAEEAEIVAELLGGTQLSRSVLNLRRDIEGLAIDWLVLPEHSPFAGRTIADGQVRTRTGVSIVAVLRDGQAVPAPEPSFRFQAGDTAVVVGTPDGIAAAATLLGC